MKPLIILRPEPGASATAAAASALGLEPLVMPLFEGKAVEWTAPDPSAFDGLLLTSASAIEYGGKQIEKYRDLPTYCVGGKTAQAAEGAGFKVVAMGRGGVDSLLQAVPSEARLLHLCAANRREPATAGRNIEPIPVYEAAERPTPEGFADIEGAVVAVHSPRGGSTFSRMVDEAKLKRDRISIVAISGDAAQAAGEGWQATEAAPEPSDSALLAIASRLCNKPA
jgi:uroporphyrinogen-III synthase